MQEALASYNHKLQQADHNKQRDMKIQRLRLTESALKSPPLPHSAHVDPPPPSQPPSLHTTLAKEPGLIP